MTHEEALKEMGVWEEFRVAYGEDGIYEEGIDYYLDKVKDKELQSAIGSFATWEKTSHGHDFWNDVHKRAWKYRDLDVCVRQALKDI